MKKIPIIIDTDPGIDDALALMMVYKYSHLFDLKLITVSSGNTPIDVTTRNAQFFADKYFNGVRLSQGQGKPLLKSNKDNAEDVHGVNGLGNFVISDQNYPYENNAVESLKDVLQSSKEKVVIIAVAPLTNIAGLLLKYPEVKDKIESIYAMIGSINGLGNIKPYAEFNAYYDPEAFKIVAESGVPMVINPLETSHYAQVEKKIIAQIDAKNEHHKMIKEMVDGLYEFRNPDKITLFDVNSVYALIKPDMYEFQSCDIDITASGEYDGKCVLTPNENSIHKYYVIKNADECNNSILNDLFSI